MNRVIRAVRFLVVASCFVAHYAAAVEPPGPPQITACETATACLELGRRLEAGAASADGAPAAYQRACDLGSGQACFRLGTMYKYELAPRDPPRGETLLKRACDLQEKPACDLVGGPSEPVAAPGSPASAARVDDPAAGSRKLFEGAQNAPVFHFDRQLALRAVLAMGIENYKGRHASVYPARYGTGPCWEARLAEARPANDEFERRDRSKAIESGFEKCFAALKAEVTPFPSTLRIQIPITKSEYDFDAQSFRLFLPNYEYSQSYNGYVIGMIPVGDPWRVHFIPITARRTITLLVQAREHGDLALTDATPGPFQDSRLGLSCPEDAARTLKARISASRPVIEVLFAPSEYGALGLKQEIGGEATLLHGLNGRAIGYRVADSAGELIGWTPFGFNSAGQEEPPAPPSSSEAAKAIVEVRERNPVDVGARECDPNAVCGMVTRVGWPEAFGSMTDRWLRLKNENGEMWVTLTEDKRSGTRAPVEIFDVEAGMGITLTNVRPSMMEWAVRRPGLTAGDMKYELVLRGDLSDLRVAAPKLKSLWTPEAIKVLEARCEAANAVMGCKMAEYFCGCITGAGNDLRKLMDFAPSEVSEWLEHNGSAPSFFSSISDSCFRGAKSSVRPEKPCRVSKKKVDGGAAIRISGRVLRVLNAVPYAFVELDTAGGKTWVAVTQTEVRVGATLVVTDAVKMEKFQSNTLKRTFDLLYFGNVESKAAPKAGAAPSTTAEKVAPATGPNARTVAQIWAQRKALSSGPVTVRGRIVKFSAGIMGYDWYHLRDGTGTAAGRDNDLTLTVKAGERTAGLEEIVTFEGTVATEKDFGAGYAYPVVVVDAKLVE